MERGSTNTINVRPDEKMSCETRNFTSVEKQIIKRNAAKKRRQRDR